MEEAIQKPERRCYKCKLTEDRLAEDYVDLLEDEESNCKIKYCENCIKQLVKCDCGKRDHNRNFKSRAVIDFEKEQKERKLYSKLEFAPQVLIEMIIETLGDKSKADLRVDIDRFAREYDDRKRREKHTIVKATVRENKDQLPIYMNDIDNLEEAEIKGTSGSREHWEKGIKAIMRSFKKMSF